MASLQTLAIAIGTLTRAAAIINTETVTIAGKVYTFQTTLTNVDGNVALGSTDAFSLRNLFAAIQLDNSGESAVGPGNDYAAAMTANPEVRGISISDTVLVVGAPGVAADRIPTVEGGAQLSWGAVTLENGAGNLALHAEDMLNFGQLNSSIIQDVRAMTVAAD